MGEITRSRVCLDYDGFSRVCSLRDARERGPDRFRQGARKQSNRDQRRKMCALDGVCSSVEATCRYLASTEGWIYCIYYCLLGGGNCVIHSIARTQLETLSFCLGGGVSHVGEVLAVGLCSSSLC